MSYSTPILNDSENIFPGENWFLYWKSSSSLWHSKLSEDKSLKRIIIPINWSFHTETGDKFDFSDEKPETNLKKLAEIANSLGRELTFILPIGPTPFLPNGGIPHFLARSISLSNDGLGYGVVDSGGKLNKMFSFYDPRVFKAFSKFVHYLGSYFNQNAIANDIFGMDSGYFSGAKFESYFKDNSSAFKQSFSKFLETKRENKNLNSTDGPFISTPEQEDGFKGEFFQTIRNLYLDTAIRSFGENWEGALKFSFLGGNNNDFFNRISGHEDIKGYSDIIFQSITHDIIPSSILLSEDSKKGILKKQLDDIVSESVLPFMTDPTLFSQEDSGLFCPLIFFEVFENQEEEVKSYWDSLNLFNFFQSEFKWAYRIHEPNDFNIDDEELEKRVFFFKGCDLNEKTFKILLRIFLAGGKIIIESNSLDLSYQRKLDTFLFENELEVEKINYQTLISNVKLGDGRILLFEGEKLLSLSKGKKELFWNKILNSFDIHYVKVESPEKINYFWRKRSITSSELDFEDVRRLDIYNPTSYKMKFKILTCKNFVLMKIIEKSNIRMETSPGEISGELLPSGNITLDFGKIY